MNNDEKAATYNLTKIVQHCAQKQKMKIQRECNSVKRKFTQNKEALALALCGLAGKTEKLSNVPN